MELPEIKAAVRALRKIENLPMPNVSSREDNQQKVDGFVMLEGGNKKGNVENQREHLVLLLANIDIRNKTNEDYSLLDNDSVRYLLDKVFKNYRSLCAYLHRESNLKFFDNNDGQ